MSTPGLRFREAVKTERPLQVVGAINAYSARVLMEGWVRIPGDVLI
ncbi:hypothetical protein [Pseudogulbenkiania sp. MAI-1]|nr:hypothetical protein [Pseudogulbenkiania sp. MAI-1]